MAFSIDLRSPRFKQIPISKISPNPYQPRKVFDREALSRLSESISRYGIITPLTVRKSDGGYVLIAGERRLRASRMAGLTTVPCYILDACDRDTSAMALVENLQRRDLDPFEEAEGLMKLTSDFGLTQQQAALLVGKTQAAVANKIRLLKLSEDVKEHIRASGLTERHARALLSLESDEQRLKAAKYISAHSLTVAQSEDYIAKLTAEPSAKPQKTVIIKDIRLFLNSIGRAVDSIKSAGIDATCTRTTEDGCMTLSIKVPLEKGR